MTISLGSNLVEEPSFFLANVQGQMDNMRGFSCWRSVKEIIITHFDESKAGNNVIRQFFEELCANVVVQAEVLLHDVDCFLDDWPWDQTF